MKQIREETAVFIVTIIAIASIVFFVGFVSSVLNPNMNLFGISKNTAGNTNLVGGASSTFNTPISSKPQTYSTQTTCTDSDKGENFQVPGTISGFSNGKYFKIDDSCKQNVLKENFCENDMPKVSYVNCKTYFGNRFVCSKNACKEIS